MRACCLDIVTSATRMPALTGGGLTAEPAITGNAQYARVRVRYGSKEKSSGQPQVRSQECRPQVCL